MKERGRLSKHKESRRRTGAQALVESLEKAGVEVVFGYPGGNVVDVFEAVRTSKFDFVLSRHEQGAVHMADGYARASGRPGVVMVTSGPGLTNTITGLGTANMDGVPMVLVCGQVPLCRIGTDAFQEADTTGLTRSVSKHNVLLHSADEIPSAIAEAFYVATHGKPGPVVIDIPLDVQREFTVEQYPVRVSLRSYHPESAASPSEVRRLAKMLNDARRPVVYAGGGVIAADAAKEVNHLAVKASVPVATTMMGIGSVDGRMPYSLGMAGVHGNRAANLALAQADVVLALGTRFNDRVTEGIDFASGAKIIHVDCDPSSINRNVRADLGIVADIKDLLSAADSRIKAVDRSKWIGKIAELKRICREKPSPSLSDQIDPRDAIDAIADVVGEDAILTTDVGQHQLFAAKYFPHVHPRKFITSGGMGSMGFGIPSAIGAAIARPGSRVVSIVGDGGAQMTFGELIVAAERKLPVVFVVFVNGTLGLVRQMQKGAKIGSFATEISSPDFKTLAAAYGIGSARVSKLPELRKAVAAAARSKSPRLIEVFVGKEVDA